MMAAQRRSRVCVGAFGAACRSRSGHRPVRRRRRRPPTADPPPTSVAFANVRAAWMRRWTIFFRRSRHSPLRAIALARAIHAERRLHLARRNVLDLPPLLRDAARHVHSSFSSPSLLLTASVLSLCRSMKSGASCRAWRRRYVATLHTTLHTTLYRADTGTRTQTQAHFGGHRDTKAHV